MREHMTQEHTMREHITQEHTIREHITPGRMMREHMAQDPMAQEPMSVQEPVIDQDILRERPQERYPSPLEELVTKQVHL